MRGDFSPLYVFSCLLVASKSVRIQTQAGKQQDGSHHDFPLGVLEATGRLKDGEKEILIMDVRSTQKTGADGRRSVMMIEGKTPDAFSKKTDTGLAGPQALLGNRSQIVFFQPRSFPLRRESDN